MIREGKAKAGTKGDAMRTRVDAIKGWDGRSIPGLYALLREALRGGAKTDAERAELYVAAWDVLRDVLFETDGDVGAGADLASRDRAGEIENEILAFERMLCDDFNYQRCHECNEWFPRARLAHFPHAFGGEQFWCTGCEKARARAHEAHVEDYREARRPV
jgi:hypothetical protein